MEQIVESESLDDCLKLRVHVPSFSNVSLRLFPQLSSQNLSSSTTHKSVSESAVTV